ncbi:MAG: S10 family peptidase [Candidatus Acidiferrales bacterium]
MKRSFAACLAVLLMFLVVPIFAAAQEGPKSPTKPSEKPVAKVPKERTVVTHASVTIDGKEIPYAATAGTLLLYDQKHEATASVFYVAYTEANEKDGDTRPVTFAYNGGPGGASALVDIGGFGPRRIVWPAVGDIQNELPPYHLVNNDYSILKSTDLVFVDAVGTGYSRIVGKGKPKMFYGVSEDASTFAQFIERYVAHFGRWNSPKFLLGESYGTTRNAVLAQDLVQQGVYLNGVIMCSTVLNFETLGFSTGNDLPYALYLPSYAAAAWYHHKLNPQPASLSAAIQQAEQFASGPYLTALFAGETLPMNQKQQIATRLSELTGVPSSLWLKSNLRMSLRVFRRRLIGPEGPATGRYDSRFTTPELEPLLPVSGQGGAGAASTAIMGALTATFDNYLDHTLGYTSSRIYTQLSFEVNRQWNFRFRSPLSELSGGGFSPDVAASLARAMNNDPGMHVMFNNGYYDMATPFFATQYTVDHMDLPPAERSNIQFDYYPVGHMLYVNPKALPMLQKNIDAFIAAASEHTGKG